MAAQLLGNRAIQAAIVAGNVNIAGAMQTEEMDLSEGSKNELLQHSEIIRKYEAQKRARTMIVPTDVDDVKSRLRSLGHPITLFGEGHFDRRERLKEVLAQAEIDAEGDIKDSGVLSSSIISTGNNGKPQQRKEVVYTSALPEMIEARKELSEYSFQRAHDRLYGRKRLYEDNNMRGAEDAAVLDLYAHSKEVVMNSSAAAEERPLVSVRYSPLGNLIATGSLGCTVKLWDTAKLEDCGNLRGHEERIMSLAWHPKAGAQSDAPALLASASADGKCILWDCRESCNAVGNPSSSMVIENQGPSKGGSIVHTLVGHKGPVADCEFHPSGRYVGTAGHDNTWRLWDTETAQELLLQDGHIKECTTLAFQSDGSLCLTGDAAGVLLLWDLRSGKSIHVCQGHVKKIRYVRYYMNDVPAFIAS